MDILLISANRERTPYPVFPLGLSYLAGPLAERGHRLKVLDLCFADDPESAVSTALDEFTPNAVVLSIRNIDNVTFPRSRSYLPGVKKIVDICRGRVPVIAGGSGFSIMPAEILAYLDADYGVVGEGEEILPELLTCISDGLTPESLPGVLVREKTGFLPARLIQSIRPAERGLFPLERYYREGGMANLQTKRGCPFSCIYCTYPLLEGRAIRVRPIGDIITEIRSLVEGFGISYIYFVDDIFNYPPEFAEELCQAMISEKLQINWTAFINPAFITPSLLQTMIAAGCDAVEFGSESGSASMLRNLGKSFTVDDLRNSSRLCREAGADFAHYILFGGPGESEATIDETFALMDELEPTAVIAMTGIRIFPGTPLHASALADGTLAAETSLLEPVFYISPPIRETLCQMVTERALARKTWVAPGLEINMSDAMLEALRHFPVRGPLWKLMKRLGRSRVRPMSAPAVENAG
ncbi:lipid biosynthesis B12-binding/radical SAM protein [Geotalea toluenoxydans]|uniref:lipid biosynthesis B12-binding/radical SAM protein n=1 Tax=Geotalea toluenoxydans TaxID=421624 RepID=UPI0006D0FC5E|nr:lipid biosynthesis B12-binding/radical SAM protein [Geotalea toluenoxydans]